MSSERICEKWWSVQPKVDLPIPNDGAKVLIVKFSDYMCPACRQTYEFYKPVLGKYLVRRPGPLRRQALSTRGGVQPQRTEQSLRVVRGGSRGHHGEAKGNGEKLEQWIFSNQIG